MTGKPRSNSPLFTLAALVTTVAALHLAREILLPIALAILVSFLLAPLADRLERIGLGRILSVLSVVSVAFVVLGLLGWVVTSQLVDLSANMSKYRTNIVAKVKAVTQGSSALQGVARTLEDVQNELTKQGKAGGATEGDQDADDSAPAAGGAPTTEPTQAEAAGEPKGQGAATGELAALLQRYAGASRGLGSDDGNSSAVEVKVISLPPTPLAQVQGWLGPLMAPLTAAGMVVVLVLFMLLQREDQRNRLIRLFGTNNIHATTEALTDIVNRVSKYLRMQFLINAGYGLCVGCGLAAIGLPNAVMFGVMSFSLRFLPYIGPWISAALPVAVSIAITEGWGQAAMVVSLFVVLELLVNNVAEPLLYGSTIGVSGMGIIVAAIFWTWIWGAIGLVLAMPLTVCLVVMARYIPSLRFITVMLGDQPTLTVEERIYQRMLAVDEDEVRELAEQELEKISPVEFYDQTLMSALRLAEQDRMAGLLSDDQEATVQELARELIVDVGVRAAETKTAAAKAQRVADSKSRDDNRDNDEPDAEAGETVRTRALCIPLCDEADRTAGLMLAQLLDAAGIETVIGAPESLTSERVEAVAAANADLVLISVLPPLPQRDSRLLCRRLRKQYPMLPIVVGYWDGSAGSESHHLLAAKGEGEIVTTLAEALERARAIASRTPARDSDEQTPSFNEIAAKAPAVSGPTREAR